MNSNKKNLEKWAKDKGLDFFAINARKQIKNRLKMNPNKNFFAANEIRQIFNRSNAVMIPEKYIDGPYIEGYIRKRMIYIYPIKGAMFLSHFGSNFIGVCLEIGTSKIPVNALVTRKYLYDFDKLDTESRYFEKLYDCNIQREGKILQLLDPVMIELIEYSSISAIEFSDSSIVLYSIIFPPKIEKINYLTYWGIKIADQVDRNFPMSKYEKK
ncbi:MAG: hypothetical protein ACNFW9_01055 [Candidatus Kerfeldbacteria bacterium]